MADWHCKQIPNGSNPLVVCEREALQAEIERLRVAGDALVESLDHSRADIRSAVAAWEEARRG